MGPKVAKEELEDIVEEAQHLDDAEREGLTRGEAREVLRELDINPDKLDEAERLVKERRASELAKQQAKKRTLMRVVAAVVAAGAIVTAVVVYTQQRASALSKIAVSQHTVTVTTSEAKLDVAVNGAPRGEPLDLTCDWVDPSGNRAHQNHWKTKAVDRDPWPTHCRLPLTPAAKTGAWTVTVKQGDRVLATDRFDVP
jgi:hypothetical protein